MPPLWKGQQAVLDEFTTGQYGQLLIIGKREVFRVFTPVLKQTLRVALQNRRKWQHEIGFLAKKSPGNLPRLISQLTWLSV
jgi:hypothetical protein